MLENKPVNQRSSRYSLACAGLPVQVARRMMQRSKALVGCMAADASEASRAAADGANLILLQVLK